MGFSRSERYKDIVLADASQGWFLSERRNQQGPNHGTTTSTISVPSARSRFCLIVGSDPAKFKRLADETKMPESRQQSCKRYYAKASRSWDVVQPYRRAADRPETRISVVYGESSPQQARHSAHDAIPVPPHQVDVCGRIEPVELEPVERVVRQLPLKDEDFVAKTCLGRKRILKEVSVADGNGFDHSRCPRSQNMRDPSVESAWPPHPRRSPLLYETGSRRKNIEGCGRNLEKP
jgi:hypothetical protein